jgi:formylglycine-generating enzyme required for sulfatase activity
VSAAEIKAELSPEWIPPLFEQLGVNFTVNTEVMEALKKLSAAGNVIAVAAEETEKKRQEDASPKPETVRSKSRDGADMVFIPAGEFWMGSDDGDSDEQPRRHVYLDAFWIDKYEVTNALYKRFWESDGQRRGNRVPLYWNDSKWNEPNQPVVGVDWWDAWYYCRWAGKRLPTEAEWEKAARGTDGRRYPWGDQWDSGRANLTENGIGKTVSVGSYPSGASPYGVQDMAGNVLEWVDDAYDKDYYKQAPSRNPKGPETTGYRVLRGGSWIYHARTLRISDRTFDVSSERYDDVGFRCAQ